MPTKPEGEYLPSPHPAPADDQKRRWRQRGARGIHRPDRKQARWIGGFPVTAGHGELEFAERYKAVGDDYRAILSQSLANRLAEAFAEAKYRKVRTELSGCAPDELFDIGALTAERYLAIRPAPSYPAQPAHAEKVTLFRLLGAEAATGTARTRVSR